VRPDHQSPRWDARYAGLFAAADPFRAGAAHWSPGHLFSIPVEERARWAFVALASHTALPALVGATWVLALILFRRYR
jgi:hypothetical protein